MTLTVINQKMQDVSPVYTLPIKGDYDPTQGIDKTILAAFYEPLGQTPVSIVDDQANVIDPDTVKDWILQSIADIGVISYEKDLKSLARQCMTHFDHQSTLRFDEFFPLQYGARLGLPQPGPNTLYTASTDVVPAAKAVLSGTGSFDDLCVNLAYTFHPQTLAFGFKTESDFEDMKTWLDQRVSQISNLLTADAVDKFKQFQSEKLDQLTASIIIRDDKDLGDEEFGFARTIVHLLMEYHNVASPDQYRVMPFLLSELYNPGTLIFVNAERHARANSDRITKEWALIDQSIKNPVRPLSSKKLRQLTTIQRNMNSAMAKASTVSGSKNSDTYRIKEIKFRNTPPAGADLYKHIVARLAKMRAVNKSMNAVTTKRSSFAYANRRQPNNVNLPGKVTSKKYLPDIHIYLDTSGSISEYNYQQTVKMLISLAKKMDVNLYFTSFSHVISQDYKIPVKGRSKPAIWNYFRSIPKVTGGTDFTLVWRRIQSSSQRQRRFNLMITDFGFYAPSTRYDHPKNLYYAPCSNMDWDRIREYAQEFANTCRHIDPNISRRFLSMR